MTTDNMSKILDSKVRINEMYMRNSEQQPGTALSIYVKD